MTDILLAGNGGASGLADYGSGIKSTATFYKVIVDHIEQPLAFRC